MKEDLKGVIASTTSSVHLCLDMWTSSNIVASDTIIPDPEPTDPAFMAVEPPKIDEEAAPQDLPSQGVQDAAPSSRLRQAAAAAARHVPCASVASSERPAALARPVLALSCFCLFGIALLE